MGLLLNRAKMTTATTGTGTVTLGSAVSPYQSYSAAGAGDGVTYTNLFEDGTAWEISNGVYTASGTTLTRVLVASSTGALLNLSGSASVACVMQANDVPQLIEYKAFAGSGGGYTFSNIPQNFNTLELEIFGRVDSAASQSVTVQVNGLSTSIYDQQRHSALSTGGSADQTLGGSSWSVFTLPGTNYASGDACGGSFRLFGYAQTSINKMFKGGSRHPNSTTTHDGYDMVFSGQVRTTNAITSITVTPGGSANFVTGSYALVRGIP